MRPARTKLIRLMLSLCVVGTIAPAILPLREFDIPLALIIVLMAGSPFFAYAIAAVSTRRNLAASLILLIGIAVSAGFQVWMMLLGVFNEVPTGYAVLALWFELLELWIGFVACLSLALAVWALTAALARR